MNGVTPSVPTTANPRRRRRRAAWLLAAGTLAGCGLLRCGVDSDFTQSPLFLAPPAPWTTARTLRVVTFNIKDMYWLSDHRAERMTAIGAALVAAAPDVVCLQEGFVGGDVAVIAGALGTIGVVHAAEYPAGVVGSGLWTFSRFPIAERFFHQYTQNGAMTDTQGGDWWAGKGVGLARLEVAPGEFLDVFNTHLICPLGPKELRDHRISQSREYAAFVSGATPTNVPALLLGDFNCGPGGREFAHFDDVLRWEPLLERRYGFDHVFGRSPGGRYTFRRGAEAQLGGQVPVGGEPPRSVSMSDHVGLLTTVTIAPR